MGPLDHEQPFKTRFQKRLLSYLLDKYERSRSFQSGGASGLRPQFAMKESPFWAEYSDEMDFRKRDWMNEVLLDLERQGVVSLVWDRFREGELLAKVYLEWDGLDDAYRLAGREPKLAKLKRLREILRPLQSHPWEWVRRFWRETDDRLAKRQNPGLALDDPEGYADLVRVLQALPGLDETGVPKRQFSQALFRDSKHFERRVERRLVGLLRAWGEFEMETEEAYLDSVGVVENPSSVWLNGPLTLVLGDRRLETAGFVGGVGLSAATVQKMEVEAVGAQRIVTIENLTSYHQWVQERVGRSELVVYTGGFPHHTLQLFLKKLAAAVARQSPELPVGHWGDVDLGGIRIFQFLKTQFFPRLQPIMMDIPTLEAHRERAVRADDKYVEKALAMRDDPGFAQWGEVLDWIAKSRLRLEQESIVDIPADV
ncbi:hypothetical protein CVV65_15055 [Kyrpidia spormannii]|uniref:Wadjet protein JetD C-terminal domain-containing protein n=1 Tax=Kyrpidia spormannii TaxID=2055160 RepID=A0A2K8NCK0_9BACL|nr:Wadjet anti-phage system protein JetD domain-containing protein [Kyrpidia spormannii]ATY86082.1 hypothetical protein CVV65_15055 [Kyrpidia spormannii]